MNTNLALPVHQALLHRWEPLYRSQLHYLVTWSTRGRRPVLKERHIETFSVALQVMYFKYTKYKTGVGQRIFLMAPLHHHYEQKGWKETQVVVRFWIITMMLVLIGLATLKLR